MYTGFRLAHPRAFVHIYTIGREEFVAFVGTLIAALATDLLVGILIGVAITLVIHFINGVPLMSLVIPHNDVTAVSATEVTIAIRDVCSKSLVSTTTSCFRIMRPQRVFAAAWGLALQTLTSDPRATS